MPYTEQSAKARLGEDRVVGDDEQRHRLVWARAVLCKRGGIRTATDSLMTWKLASSSRCSGLSVFHVTTLAVALLWPPPFDVCCHLHSMPLAAEQTERMCIMSSACLLRQLVKTYSVECIQTTQESCEAGKRRCSTNSKGRALHYRRDEIPLGRLLQRRKLQHVGQLIAHRHRVLLQLLELPCLLCLPNGGFCFSGPLDLFGGRPRRGSESKASEPLETLKMPVACPRLNRA
eukprot:6185358-Pleurochrysis_carterae.AAC.2